MLTNKILLITQMGDTVKATYYDGNRMATVTEKMSNLPFPDDFFYGCGWVLDELAKIPSELPFEGKTVCIESDFTELFTVGKIYEWKDGRTVANDGVIYPTQRKLYSLDEITNPHLKFIKIVD